MVMVYILNDCCASSTFALGFLARPFSGTAGGSRGGVVDTRSGVEAAIGLQRDVRWAAGAALQRELAKRVTRDRSKECPR
ncbi:hypothetical protein K469DRAFT_300101 [Zopfia rhizophila CBS 207.26]|uniref:Uncharacterized protein n=1 Tax=Zopfia rhizophila CBS 207.26 TaxID=1314779 RepID=A0A6A6DJ79_9PEZI|nr:hypothetical protein K469DRAFT_300101 [Zopfia rhizophila CBS 207.26]